MFCLCSGNRFFHFPCFQGLLTVVFRSSHIYIIYRTTSCTTSQSVYLKSFKELSFLSCSRFSGKAFAKVRRFFVTSKFFRKFFLKKFSEGVRLVLSRSLAHPQGKILGAAVSTLFRSLKLHSVCHLQRLSLSKAVAKVRTFFIHATFTAHFFAKFFQVLV